MDLAVKQIYTALPLNNYVKFLNAQYINFIRLLRGLYEIHVKEFLAMYKCSINGSYCFYILLMTLKIES